jgi:hypothetical protein
MRLISSILLLLAAITLPASAREGGRCDYCGCHGGPGYRGPNGQCVGKANLTRVCGSSPSSRCTFEGRSKGQ